MNNRYIGWVILKSIMGSLFMFDSLNMATQQSSQGIATALITTGNASTFCLGFFVVLSGLIGGFGVLTENYHLKDEGVAGSH